MRSRWILRLGASLTGFMLLATACKDTTAPADSYIRAEITGAVQDTFRSSMRAASWYHARRASDVLKVEGSETRNLDRHPMHHSRRMIVLYGLGRAAFPEGSGAIPLSALEMRESADSGFTAVYFHGSERYASQRGFIRVTEMTIDSIAGAFTFHAFRYCAGGEPDPCLVPDRPPENAVWVEVNGRFKGPRPAPPDPRR